ncbi:type II secretion system protein [Lacticaseibacillus porcinae]|uniref:type II secretion system protein n=1 Tax=Lacticaseibacillus porcinae TaxID=1123687 RepID=UPI0013DE3149|nr:prepilin-type N-terminal cleavage/methylation domain-containing protein [Lacticaseibacillus porcinae]
MKRTRQKGFTLIEVLAALGIIIVLTLTLVVTIRAQLQKANDENLRSVAAAMNMQIAVAYEQVDRQDGNFGSIAALLSAGIITPDQADQANKNAKLVYDAKTNPPAFSVK